MGFDVIYTSPRVKVYSSRESIAAVVVRWCGQRKRQFTFYQRMVRNLQGTCKNVLVSKTEAGPKTLKYRRIRGPRDREADRWRIDSQTP